MPQAMLHYYFAKDIYKNLDTKYKEQIHLDDAKVFLYANILDIPFYFRYTRLNKKDPYNLGYKLHNYKTKEFFTLAIEYTQNHGFDKDNVSFVYGALTHYLLDLYLNPFLYSRSGIDRLKQHDKKYKGNYDKYIKAIDYIFFAQREKPNTNMNHRLKGAFLLNFNDYNILDDIFFKGYSFPRSYEYLKISMKSAKKRCKYIGLSSYVPNHYNKNVDYTNSSKASWEDPISGEVRNESIFELYNEALKESVKYLDAINDYLWHNKKSKFDSLFKEISIDTGNESEIFNYQTPIKL